MVARHSRPALSPTSAPSQVIRRPTAPSQLGPGMRPCPRSRCGPGAGGARELPGVGETGVARGDGLEADGITLFSPSGSCRPPSSSATGPGSGAAVSVSRRLIFFRTTYSGSSADDGSTPKTPKTPKDMPATVHRKGMQRIGPQNVFTTVPREPCRFRGGYRRGALDGVATARDPGADGWTEADREGIGVTGATVGLDGSAALGSLVGPALSVRRSVRRSAGRNGTTGRARHSTVRASPSGAAGSRGCSPGAGREAPSGSRARRRPSGAAAVRPGRRHRRSGPHRRPRAASCGGTRRGGSPRSGRGVGRGGRRGAAG